VNLFCFDDQVIPYLIYFRIFNAVLDCNRTLLLSILAYNGLFGPKNTLWVGFCSDQVLSKNILYLFYFWFINSVLDCNRTLLLSILAYDGLFGLRTLAGLGFAVTRYLVRIFHISPISCSLMQFSTVMGFNYCSS